MGDQVLIFEPLEFMLMVFLMGVLLLTEPLDLMLMECSLDIENILSDVVMAGIGASSDSDGKKRRSS